MGRDKDRKKIVELLMDSNGHNVSVIPIVGIGGLGKTALAKLVYNDQRVVDHFDSKLWVCLGDMKKFDANHVITTITGQTNSQGLENVIRENFGSKKFLLVLDDLWDADRSKWLDLKGMLASSARGSKILVTTRDSSVARCVGTIPAHNLGGLAHEKCVSLFKKVAFASEAEVDQSLMKIGYEIVKKCKGVPLAVRTLGSHLFSKPDESEWKSVRDSGIWQINEEQNDILAILRFSYDRLPSHLKLCFVHCSVFPEDYHILGRDLISLWMAHGLLKGNDPEYLGKQYINEFLSRGFFQDFYPVETWWDAFKMHDLVGDLARSLSKDEFRTKDAKHENVSHNGRHMWFECGKEENLANSNNRVRSVIINRKCDIKLPVAFFSKCNNLRLLWVLKSEVVELPKCVGSLKYLKCLNLDHCKELKKLPESICKLHNLETLSLFNCLEFEEIPKNIGDLVNLRWLTVTTKQKHLPNNGIESLTSLQFLAFYCCQNLETLFGGTQIQLKSLRTLIVYDSIRVKSLCRLSGSASKQHSLPALEILELNNCHSIEDASKFLQITPKLVSLKIDYCKQLETLSDSKPECAHTLRSLTIKCCVQLKALPEWLPNLTSLRTFSLKDCFNLSSLPQGMENLTALQSIEIIDCGKLSERCRKEGGEEWFKIARVPNTKIV